MSIKPCLSFGLAVILLCCALLCGCESTPQWPEYVMEPIEVEQGIGFCGQTNWPLYSGRYGGLPLCVEIQHNDFSYDSITYTFHSNVGYYQPLRQPSLYGLETTSNGSVVCWHNQRNNDDFGENVAKYHVVFTEILILCEEQIIGYAVVCYDRTPYQWGDYYTPIDTYDLHLLAAYLFPKVDGEFQAVTEEYVHMCMDKAIENYGK